MKILVAVDNSKCSHEAVSSIAERLWKQGSEFLVVHVIEPVSFEYAAMFITYTTAYGRVVAERLCDAQDLVKKTAEYLKNNIPSAKVESIVLEGPVKECLIEKAKEWQADIIMMGSHGRTGLSKLMLGSVAESVLSNSPCSVEIIRSTSLRENNHPVALQI